MGDAGNRRHHADESWHRVRGQSRRARSVARPVLRHGPRREPGGIGAAPESVPAGLAASGAILRTTPQDFSASWAFVLEPLDGGRTRLIERFRVRFGNGGPQFRVIGPVMGFGVLVMMRRQMLGIRDRAVLTAVAPGLPDQATAKPGQVPANPRGREPAERTDVLVSA